MTTLDSHYESWINGLSLDRISEILKHLGCREAFVKLLAPNNNSKNQIYLAPDLVDLSRLPTGPAVASEVGSGKARAHNQIKLHCPVDFHWVAPSGPVNAPDAKLIFYPQYPEVRFSGFLIRCQDPPSLLLAKEKRGTEAGRTLILAPNSQGEVFGMVLTPESPAARQFWSERHDTYGVMSVLPITKPVVAGAGSDIFGRICEISDAGFVESKRLDRHGLMIPYQAQNGCGYTLEALLGIMPNGRSEPDYQGWEVKGHGVRSLEADPQGVITMFTPEPDGGLYSTSGVESFLNHYGYEAQGDPDRVNFSSIHRVTDGWNDKTGLRLELRGYSPLQAFREDGAVVLLDRKDKIAASWSFGKLLTHWKCKHAMAVFVPAISRTMEFRQYRYGSRVLRGVGTSFNLFLEAIASGSIYYDPGINMKRQSDGSWKPKKRNQFRTKIGKLAQLYESLELVDACRPNLSARVVSSEFEH